MIAATATAAANVIRIARRRRPRPAPLGLRMLFVVVWWGMDEWGGMHKRRTPTQRQTPPLSSAARRTHASTHARFARFDSHMLLPTQRFWAGPVSREHCFLGTTVLLSRCELALQSFHLQLRTRCSTTVYGLDHGGGGSCGRSCWGRRKRLVVLHPFSSLLPSLPSLHLASFPWAWAQGRVASTHLGTGIAPSPPPPPSFCRCVTQNTA